MTEGVDYSFTRPDPHCLKASGKDFAVRYVGTTSGKNLSPDERSRLQSAGLDLVAVYQTTAGFMAAGSSGVIAATRAHDNAVQCGMPPDRPIYFALDRDPAGLNGGEWLNVERFCGQAASVLGSHRVGVYGGDRAINRLVPKYAAYGWQTYAWSGGRVSEHAHLYQYRNGVNICGGAVDLCRSLADDFGQWAWSTPPPPPPPPEGVTVPVPLPVLRSGHSGGAVRSLQSLLNTKAGQGLTIDGAFGRRTDQAVRNVQSFFGLVVDGIVGQHTWGVLFL